MLNKDILNLLAQPFKGSEVQWKVQADPYGDSDKGLVVPYIDARLAIKRLNEVCGGNWSTRFNQVPLSLARNDVQYACIECQLTISDVTRCDAGSVPLNKGASIDIIKDAYSDALKRASVHFGVASYLYALPTVNAVCRKNKNNKWYLPNDSYDELEAYIQSIYDGKERFTGYKLISFRDIVSNNNSKPEPTKPEEPVNPNTGINVAGYIKRIKQLHEIEAKAGHKRPVEENQPLEQLTPGQLVDLGTKVSARCKQLQLI